MRLALALALVLAVAPRVAQAKGDKHPAKDDDASDDEADDASDDEADDTPKQAKPKAKAKAKADDDAAADQDAAPAADEPKKQDLTGHDLGKKQATAFERDRFFVDKADTDETEAGTLIQGSLTSSSFVYTEAGGPLVAGATNPNNNDNARFSRLFTDLRLQTDFRHIKGSRWEARVDGRIRLVDPAQQLPLTSTPANPNSPTTADHIQSGLTGQNEYELRELWLIRNGERTDLILGRQFITDLAAVKIDGLRIDYASSRKFTLFGFGGLYPLRGSRSLTTDYIELKTNTGTDAGRLVGSGGFGAAYRTVNAYGAFGGVALVPLQGEQPRIFGTSNGYWRFGSKLDLYHFAVVDLIGNNDALGAGNAGLTNLSVGANYKPSERLRLTGSYNRVDTETLNVQASAFLTQPDATNVVQNEVVIKRLATNALRGSLSAGLGELQRFEITVASAFRYRPGFTLSPPGAATGIALPAAEGVEVYGSITDRRSIKNARLGADVIRTFGVGSVAFQRSEVFALRGFAAHDIKDGRGEWEAELSYATTKDSQPMMGGLCNNPVGGADLLNCFGATNGSIVSLGGTLYYRFNRDWFGIASAYLSRTSIVPVGATADPTITGVTGYARLAYRF